jgi:hypothetical protein
MLLLSDSPCLKLLFYIVPIIIQAFIVTGHQFLNPLLLESGRLWPQPAGRTAARHSHYHDLRWTFYLISFTISSLMTFSPYTSHTWRWISAGFTFLAFKKRITDRIWQSAGRSIILNILNAQNSTYWRLWLVSARGKTARMREITTSERCGGNIRTRYWLSEYASYFPELYNI